MDQPLLKVSVENFGPIRQGTVEFKPLTVFVGANNSGKSYMGILLYSLFQALSNRGSIRAVRNRSFADQQARAARAWVSRVARSVPAGDDTFRGQIPENIQSMIQDTFDAQMSSLAQRIPSTLTDYFGCDKLSDLAFKGPTSKRTLAVAVGEARNEAPFLHVVQEPDEPSPTIHRRTPLVGEVDLQRLNLLEWWDEYFAEPEFGFLLICLDMWQQVVESKGFPQGGSY